MSLPSLTKLTIAHLRGSVELFELPFKKNVRLTVIYGENGTGKSTICDALELLSKGRVGSLDNRGLGKTNQYWTSVTKKPSDVAVTLHTASSTCAAKIVKGEAVVQPAEHRPRVEVLRRSQILDLVEARPGERYTAVSRFIDVTPIETSENALRKLITDLNSQRNLAAAGILENRTTIEQFWETAGAPAPDAFTWAKTVATQQPQDAMSELAALRLLQSAYTRLAEFPRLLQDANQRRDDAKLHAHQAQQQADAVQVQIGQQASELVQLLEAVQVYLRHSAVDVCPVCERDVASQNLSQRIDQRLAVFAAFQSAQAQEAQLEVQVQRAEQDVDLLRRQATQAATAFEQARAAFAWSPDIQLPTAPAPQDTALLVAWLAATAALPEQWNDAESKRYDSNQFFTALNRALDTYLTNMTGQQELDVLLPNLQRTLNIVEEERKAFTDKTLRTIADEVGRMYEVVHPGEGLNKIALQLDLAKRASLDIGTMFGAHHNAPPQAYFSQSHLDTLGLCVFLALATLDDPANTILVLDDVLASIDEPHVDRLIGMLYTEAAKFRHCIVTTHYGPWRHKMRWGWLKNDECDFVELSRWSNVNGISVIRSVPEVERLRALLAEPIPDTQIVCAKAGVILEAALDFLTQLYECSVPRKAEPRYTLGELLPAINSKLRKKLRVEMLTGKDTSNVPIYTTIELAPMLEGLQLMMHTRNIMGCHFNALAFELHDADAIMFGQQVLALIEALADPIAGWPRNSKSGSYWSNAGETRRLHPLKQPS